ncbi:polysaccharide pyruvyl transferase family protein [Rhizobium leguminosarum]|uniref:polysaccharide pyruvyl transferase family protein n=1 Tax=Rhizobium leguminosarum TaxID=384 RepID=UPI00144200F1|nr:polysaccharide pyruvyl transferase family protein [Rhizobium leguminosarum]NKK67972.1 exov-like protein [Rhizobium leguminosarum bv. viciae]NKL07719.1 exov-like protein [Rhizobium leguminosarum bv. viciae]NKL85303.1 exov-like protein [Rhizobium leguminosarum bv. viciae]NKL94973.1 exov-like protein [Rhizobium leguminosarum bv. viciae]NKM95563.1 exov-like protein [Rhizobium leguminosarum bv. viciae]
MFLYYFKASVSNFGDELNAWLWPQIMPEVKFDEDQSTVVLPIGSIIQDTFPASSRKIVLGSGYGGYAPRPTVDQTWSFYFVRGPQTAEVLGIDPKLAITDAAILLRARPELLDPRPKKHAVSFMPHWESVLYGSWREIADGAGINIIDPTADVDHILDELRATEVLVTEAMHGAIVADTLRVPWIPVVPTGPAHRFKWMDWCRSMSVAYEPDKIGPSTTMEWVKLTKISPNHLARRVTRRMGWISDPFVRASAIKQLKRIAKLKPILSSDAVCMQRAEQAFEKLQLFRNDYARGAFDN